MSSDMVTMNIKVSAVAIARLDALVSKTEADSVGEVIGNALRLYEYVIMQAEAGERMLDLDQVFESTAKG